MILYSITVSRLNVISNMSPLFVNVDLSFISTNLQVMDHTTQT